MNTWFQWATLQVYCHYWRNWIKRILRSFPLRRGVHGLVEHTSSKCRMVSHWIYDEHLNSLLIGRRICFSAAFPSCQWAEWNQESKTLWKRRKVHLLRAVYSHEYHSDGGVQLWPPKTWTKKSHHASREAIVSCRLRPSAFYSLFHGDRINHVGLSELYESLGWPRQDAISGPQIPIWWWSEWSSYAS